MSHRPRSLEIDTVEEGCCKGWRKGKDVSHTGMQKCRGSLDSSVQWGTAVFASYFAFDAVGSLGVTVLTTALDQNMSLEVISTRPSREYTYWVFEHTFNASLREKLLSQWAQGNGFTAKWIRLCRLRSWLRLKLWGHWSHLNGRSGAGAGMPWGGMWPPYRCCVFATCPLLKPDKIPGCIPPIIAMGLLGL